MKKILSVACIAVVAALMVAPALAGEGHHHGKSHALNAEVVSFDTKAKTLTFKDEKGEVKTAPVLDTAVPQLGSLKAGDKVTLDCADNDRGEHQGVASIKVAMAKKEK